MTEGMLTKQLNYMEYFSDLPDENGRVEILNIHTAKMRANGKLSKEVDIYTLARKTHNLN